MNWVRSVLLSLDMVANPRMNGTQTYGIQVELSGTSKFRQDIFAVPNQLLSSLILQLCQSRWTLFERKSYMICAYVRLRS